MFITALLSAFMNNTTVTALVTGPVVGVCRKLKINPFKVLIPVAYSSILGGTCTLIGTSTNVAVSGYMGNIGMAPLHFFEILWIGLILCGAGITFILIFWRKLLPDYKEGTYAEEYKIKQYLSELIITENSPLIGQQAFQSNLSNWNVRIIKIIRSREELIPNSKTEFNLQDILLVECRVEDLIKVKETEGIKVLADTLKQIQSDKIRLMEVLITPDSRLLDRSLKETRFRQTFDVVVLGVHRFGTSTLKKIANLRFKVGDVLLMQGTEESLNKMKISGEFSVIGDFKVIMFKERKGIVAAIIFLIAF